MKRLKTITAELQEISINDTNALAILTDTMASGKILSVEYQGSGWRTIQPYGWSSSKDGNILLMCYKATGEIRSYRLDRISNIMIDSSIIDDVDSILNFEDFEMPLLPNIDEIQRITEEESEAPYDKGIDMLSDNSPVDIPVDIPSTDSLPENTLTDDMPAEETENTEFEDMPLPNMDTDTNIDEQENTNVEDTNTEDTNADTLNEELPSEDEEMQSLELPEEENPENE